MGELTLYAHSHKVTVTLGVINILMEEPVTILVLLVSVLHLISLAPMPDIFSISAANLRVVFFKSHAPGVCISYWLALIPQKLNSHLVWFAGRLLSN